MSFRLSYELHAACKESADKKGQTLAEWIRRALQEKLESEQVFEVSKKVTGMNEEQLRDLMRGMLTEELDSRGIYSGTIKTAAVSSPETKFEKAALKQRSF